MAYCLGIDSPSRSLGRSDPASMGFLGARASCARPEPIETPEDGYERSHAGRSPVRHPTLPKSPGRSIMNYGSVTFVTGSNRPWIIITRVHMSGFLTCRVLSVNNYVLQGLNIISILIELQSKYPEMFVHQPPPTYRSLNEPILMPFATLGLLQL